VDYLDTHLTVFVVQTSRDKEFLHTGHDQGGLYTTRTWPFSLLLPYSSCSNAIVELLVVTPFFIPRRPSGLPRHALGRFCRTNFSGKEFLHTGHDQGGLYTTRTWPFSQLQPHSLQSNAIVELSVVTPFFIPRRPSGLPRHALGRFVMYKLLRTRSFYTPATAW
jgi:hypothetical protein